MTFVVDRFKGAPKEDVAVISLDHGALWAWLRALVEIDEQYLRAHPDTPLLYDAYHAGLVWYQEEPPGQEDWLDIPTMLAQHACDCEEIAAWRVAELRVWFGAQAEPWFVWQQSEQPDKDGKFSNLYHIQVRFFDPQTGQWLIEDPCRKLGMK